ncbi:MAG: HAMP domain-containing histidine kinase [Lachnospiraceae bacterium]|jgi:signal transduction histidine kinase|nr:HAMP domain-containing histidine kinase [Lachnospiraceae bacterium]
MKIRNKLIIALAVAVIVPSVFVAVYLHFFGNRDHEHIEQIDVTSVNSTNSIELLGYIIDKSYDELVSVSKEEPDKLKDKEWLNKFDKELNTSDSFLVVTDENGPIFVGTLHGVGEKKKENIVKILPNYGQIKDFKDNGIYIGGDYEILLKFVAFKWNDGSNGTAYVVMKTSLMQTEMKQFTMDIIAFGVIIVIIMISGLVFWIYSTLMKPLNILSKAADSIKDGDLNFELPLNSKDEIGDLSRNVDTMRNHLKENAEQRIEDELEYRELIQNISHDLRTPVTSIKGYAEGIIDGVANTPEKMNKYIEIIYNKAAGLDDLLDELTFYSRLDTKTMPFDFTVMTVRDWISLDDIEEIRLDMDTKGIKFEFYNTADLDTKVWVDYFKTKRVGYNILSNAVNHIHRPDGKITMRVKDVGDFIQMEFEDNGDGISKEDLPHIFDRFYRVDSARTTNKGGSGIGLSIVKKIIDEHGGKIWATSTLGKGTTIYHTVKKYMEVN